MGENSVFKPDGKLRLRPGDVILIKGKSLISPLIRWWTNCAFTHTGLVISKNHIVESTADWEKGDTGNVRITPIKHYAEQDKIVLRPRLSFKQRMQAIKTALTKIGKPYDTLGFFRLGLKKHLNIDLPRTTQAFTCTNLLTRSLRKAGLNIRYWLPSQFLRSKKFKVMH